MMIDAYIRLAIFIVIGASIVYIPILFVLKRKGKRVIRQLSYLALFFSALFIVFVTIILFNIPLDFKPEDYVLNLIPFGRFKEEEINILGTITTEIIPNIMIFIPLGLFIPIVFEKTRKLHNTALTIFLITFTIEFFQYFIGRSSDVDDLIANLVGGIVGYGMFKIFDYLLKNKKWWNIFTNRAMTS